MVLNLLKPSQLGEIPKDWKRVKISDVMKVRQGLQIAISERLTSPTSTSKEYITIQSIKKTDQVREYVEAPSQRVICSKDDVLMTRTGNTGIVVTGVEGAFHNNFFLMDFDKNRIDTTFLVNYLRSPRIQHLILTKAGASTIPDLNHKDFYSIEFPLAPILEQQKIAKILSTWDKAISTTERLIENSTQQKKALMQQLLTGKKRLLDESGKRFKNEWKQVIFGEVAKLSSKKYNPLKANQCLPCIELEHLDQASGRILGSANANELASMKNHFEAGSVLFGKLRPYLRKYARPNFEGVCSTEIWVFKTTPQLLDEYLFHFVQTDKFVSESNKSSGSKMPRADWGVVSELVIKIPNLKEQQKIATVLTNADKEIELLEQQLADFQQEKKALMQVLLTGKKRVVVDGAVAGS